MGTTFQFRQRLIYPWNQQRRKIYTDGLKTMGLRQWFRAKDRLVICILCLGIGLGLAFWQGFSGTLPTQAIAAEPELLTIYQPLQTIQWEGPYISSKGVAYYGLNEYQGTAGVVESDLEAARSMRDTQREAEILLKLALHDYLQNNFDRAIVAYKQGLTVAKANGHDQLEGLFLASLGLVYAQKGIYQEALEYLHDYWVFVGRRGDRKEESRLLSNLGNAYFGGDLYLKAIEFHQKRLALAQQVGDRPGEGRALGNLGVVYQALGNTTKAIALHEQQLTIARQVQDLVGQKMALANLGIAYHTQGDYAQAIAHQQQRLTLAQQTNDLKATAEALANLAGAEYFLGHYDRAIALYDQAWQLTWDKLNDADVLYGLRGNQGLAYFQKGNDAKALELYQQYFTYVSSRQNRRGEGVAKNNAAAVRFRQGNLPAAEKGLREAIAAWDSLRSRLGSNDAYKVWLFETQQAPYINLQRVLRLQKKSADALEIAEQGRARAFVELLARRRDPDKPPRILPPVPVPTVTSIQQVAQAANATLVEYSLIVKPIKNQSKLQAQETELLVWVVAPGGTIVGRSVDLSALQRQNLTLAELVSRNRNFIGTNSRGLGVVAVSGTRQAGDQGMDELHRLLIQPIADLLLQDANAPVIFLPQGALFLVPFAALQDTNRRYLIEQHTTLVAPSIQVLGLVQQAAGNRNREIGNRPTGSQKAGTPISTLTPGLIVGNPTMPQVTLAAGQPPETLPSLPGAEKEAKEIAQLLGTQAMTGNAATKATVLQQMQSARLVHLATHGLLDDFTGLGMPGAIALAPGDRQKALPDDGLLTASELLDLRLPANLVVLSACDTGRGKITGDGVIGLSRSLLAAGVPSLVVSLWAVPDAPTASLMTQFYQQLQQGHAKAQAIRQAMLTTLKQYPNPRDWAAFTLMGVGD